MNLLVTPLDIALVPFFLWFGETLMRVQQRTSLSPQVMIDALKRDIKAGLMEYGAAFGYAILG